MDTFDVRRRTGADQRVSKIIVGRGQVLGEMPTYIRPNFKLVLLFDFVSKATL